MQLTVVVILAAAAFWYWKSSRRLSLSERKRLFWRAAMTVGGIALLFLVATGRMHIFAALGTVLLASFRRLPLLLKLWPLWRKLQGQAAAGQDRPHADNGGNRYRKRYSGGMNVEEARRILEVDADADELTIVQAHRRLMQKVHPDRGGSDDLAARVNEAKARLMDELT